MKTLIIETLRFERGEALNIARSVPETHAAQRVAGLAQTPAWIVCHYYLADNLLGGHLGMVPGDMSVLMRDVGPESDVDKAGQAMRTHFGSYAGAIEAAARSHAALLEAMDRTSQGTLEAPHPSDRARKCFPTLGHNLVYTVWHEGNHGGQLRAWMHAARRAGLIEV